MWCLSIVYKKIGQDFLYWVETRCDKSLYSSYDIINFMTFWVTDGILSGAEERRGKMFDSKMESANYVEIPDLVG